MPHEGYKVTTQKKSVQGLWQSNMWNTYPKHGIQEFMEMPKFNLTLENIGAIKKNVKRNIPKTFLHKFKRDAKIFPDL